MHRNSIAAWGLFWSLLSFFWNAVPASAETLSEQKQRTLALADSLYEATAADSAQAILAAAIPVARAENDSLYLQNLIVRQGAQMAAFGNVQPAEPILREALALAEARSDSAVICQVLRWLGYSLGNQGRWDEAKATTRRQIELAEALQLRQMTGWAQVALGWYAEQRGQAQEAAGEYRLAARIFRDVADSTGLAWSLNNLGNALIDLGDREGTETAYLESAEIARRLDFTMVEAMAVNNLGVMEFEGGDPGVAVARFRRAHELQARLDHKIEKVRTGLNIGLCLVILDRLDEAAAQLTGIVTEAEALEQPGLCAQARLALASLRHRQGQAAAAKQLLHRVIDEPMDLSPAERTEAMQSLAAILADQDSVGAGLELLDQAAVLLTGQTNSARALRADNLRGDLLVRSGHAREGLSVLLQTETRAREIGLSGQRVQALTQAARAYRALERPDSSLALLARAAVVWEAERDLPLDPEWREQRGAVGSRIYTDWAAHLLDAESGVDRDKRLQIAFGHLQRFKGRTLLERMSGPGDKLPQVIPDEAVGPITLDHLRNHVLAEDELLLDAYLGPETSLLFAVTPEEVRTQVWPSAPELEKRLGFFYNLHQLPATGTATSEELQVLQSMGWELGNLLLGDIADLVVGSRRLVVIPDGVLNLLPWTSLVVSDPTSGDTGIELASKQVTTVPSVTIFASLRSHADAGGGAGPATVCVFTGGESAGAPPLPGARREADWLANSFAQVTRRRAAGPGDLAGWRDFDVLHFAAHARSHDASPWQSEIRLGEGPEQAVRAATIAGADLNAELAVLAGCESAGGNILSGEGVQGLTSAFLGAGTSAVLATLWPVDDQATLDLVRHFYRELAAGQTAGAALTAAQNALRSDPGTAHPFFWAGFQLTGDGSVTVNLQRKGNRTWWLALPAGILILFVISSSRKRHS